MQCQHILGKGSFYGRDFKVDEHIIFSVGSISLKGKRGIVSFGIFGKVFVVKAKRIYMVSPTSILAPLIY